MSMGCQSQFRLAILACAFILASLGPTVAKTGPCPSGWTRLFEVDAKLYPFASNCYQHELGTLHYVDEGPRDAAHTILFVHGNPNWSFMFHDAMQDMVGKGHRVVSLDQFGFGFSDSLPPERFRYTPREQSRILEEFVVALDLRSITVVVHDWGGPIGLGMAGRQPDRIARLVINNTTGFLPDFDADTYVSRANQWGVMASRGMDRLIAGCVVPKGASHAEALAYDPTKGDVYKSVYAATLGSFLDDAGRPRHPWSCGPPVWMPATIATDRPYLQEIEANLSKLRGKPYTLMYALGDQIFGEIHADMRDPRAPGCPSGLSAMCDPKILVQGDSCESTRRNPLNDAWVCRRPDGTRIAPYADKFRSILGDQYLVFFAKPAHERHWVGSHAATRALIRYALDTVLDYE